MLANTERICCPKHKGCIWQLLQQRASLAGQEHAFFFNKSSISYPEQTLIQGPTVSHSFSCLHIWVVTSLRRNPTPPPPNSSWMQVPAPHLQQHNLDGSWGLTGTRQSTETPTQGSAQNPAWEQGVGVKPSQHNCPSPSDSKEKQNSKRSKKTGRNKGCTF